MVDISIAKGHTSVRVQSGRPRLQGRISSADRAETIYDRGEKVSLMRVGLAIWSSPHSKFARSALRMRSDGSWEMLRLKWRAEGHFHDHAIFTVHAQPSIHTREILTFRQRVFRATHCNPYVPTTEAEDFSTVAYPRQRHDIVDEDIDEKTQDHRGHGN